MATYINKNSDLDQPSMTGEDSSTGKTVNVIVTDGAFLTHLAASDISPDSSLSDFDTIIIPQATETAIPIENLDTWDEMDFTVDLTAADTITVMQSLDGTNYFAVDPIDLGDGALLGAAGVISADGAFKMPLVGTSASFTKTGTQAAATIRWRTRIAGR